jgi:hypothetical protein
VTSIDLNTDGNDEVLVYNDLPSFCGTGGCLLEGYRKQKGVWKKILSSLAYKEVASIDAPLGSYVDLVVSVQGGDEVYQKRVVCPKTDS